MSEHVEKLKALKAERQVIMNSKTLSIDEKKSMLIELNASIMRHLAQKMKHENAADRKEMLARLKQKSSDILAAAIAEQSAKGWWQL